MKKLLYFCAIAALFSSCGGDNKNEFRNDFDQMADWGFASPMLKKGNAHSGHYYCGLDSTSDYSITFKRRLGDLPLQNLKTVNASAWIRTKSLDTKASFVLTIDSAGGSLAYKSVPLKDFITEPNKWTEVKGTLEVPNNANPNYILTIYLYNAGKESVDLDDILFEINN
jgi:hypothetical protein